MKSVSSAWKSLQQIRVFKLSILQFLLICFGLAILFVLGSLLFYYHRYSGMIDARLSGKLVQRESRIFTSPKRILLGEAISLAQISNYLEAAGYSISPSADAIGQIRVEKSTIQIRPSANS